LYRVARKSASLLRTSSVIAALAASVVVLGATMTPAQATFPGKNGKIAFTHTFTNITPEREGNEVTSDIYTVNPDGTNLTNLTADTSYITADTSTSVSEGGAAWSPDGAKIAFVSSFDSKSDIYVADADGSNPKRLTNNEYRFQAVGSWSPDGAKMVLSCLPPASYDVCTMDAEGSNLTQLTTKGEYEEPNWSPDGKKIAFESASGGIYTMNPDGSNRTLAIAPVSDQPDWSPDGTKIAYRRYPSGQIHSDIYIANADGSNPVNLTARISNTSDEAVPAWSPDGTQIAFASSLHEYDETTYEIFVIDADGRNLKRLTHGTGSNWDPDWQPLPGPTEATPEKQQQERQQNQQQQPSQHGSKSRSLTVHPPDTGGPSLLLVASALFFSGGSLLYAVVRRRM
jgi:TolB protein